MNARHTGAEKQIRSFIAKFEPRHRVLIRAVRRALRRRFPTAHELVYDNYNFFVIGYGPTERPSDCLFSITAASSSSAPCRPNSGPAGGMPDQTGRTGTTSFIAARAEPGPPRNSSATHRGRAAAGPPSPRLRRDKQAAALR